MCFGEMIFQLRSSKVQQSKEVFSVKNISLGLNNRDGEKVRIKASLFLSVAFLFSVSAKRSASAGTGSKLTRESPDFQERLAGWQRGEDEEHSSPALCYHFLFTNGINRAAQRKASAPVPRQKKNTERRQGSISVQLCTPSVVNISSVQRVSSALSLSCEAVFMPGH